MNNPVWIDEKGKIIEPEYCRDFLSRHPMRCINDRFYTVDGPLPDESKLKRTIYEEISPWLHAKVAQTVEQIIKALKLAAYAPATKVVEAPVLPTISVKMYCGNWCWSASVRSMPISGRMWKAFRKNGCNAAVPIRNAISVRIGSEWSGPRNGWLTWMFFCPDFITIKPSVCWFS